MMYLLMTDLVGEMGAEQLCTCYQAARRSREFAPCLELALRRCVPPLKGRWTPKRKTNQHHNWLVRKERAWKDSNLRHTAPETVALSPELQAHKEETAR